MLRMVRLWALAALLVGCSCDDPEDVDAGALDGALPGVDAAGVDAGGGSDAGDEDGGASPTDAAASDAAAIDGATDAGPPRCGNGVIEPPEDCDDGNTTSSDGCSDVCALEVAPGCGNGVREIGEGCDDGNVLDDDACLSSCSAASCGDAIVRNDLASGAPGYEACDDGSRSDLDGCLDGASGSCALARCGDGVVRRDVASGQPGHEECDDGGTSPGDGCDASCQLEAGACGDGNMDSGEECDLGAANDDEASGTCPTTCRRACVCPRCGDGVADFADGEQCDDGGTGAGDGCDATCQVEPIVTCGDGLLDLGRGEECDDGGTASGDGCDGTCQLEPVGATCGDSTVDPLEACDPPDGIPADGDGCNATCNLDGTVTTLTTGVVTNAIATDDAHLYLALGGCGPTAPACGIAELDLAPCLAAPNTAACVPTKFVGGGPGLCACGTAPVDGPLATATYAPGSTITTDGVKVWLGSGHTLRELDIATGTVTTVAGRAGSCAAIDGVGTNALFHDIRGLTYWNGAVYLLDGCEQVLRRFDPRTRGVVTIGGTRQPDPSVTQAPPYTCSSTFSCVDGTPTEGYGTSAIYGSPRYMTADNAGNLYFIDTNGQAIWRYNTVTTYSSILVQGGAVGVGSGPYVDGAASAVTLGRPRAITSDGTSLYFSEQNYATIRQLELGPVTTTTFVGALGCAADQTAASPRDGLGADTQQVYCRGAGAAPAGVPIFNSMLGALTFSFEHRSLFVIDQGILRRVE